MKNVAVVFGGRSVEHEVSIITGMQIIENMDRNQFNPVPIYITKEGKWLSGKSLLDFKAFKEEDFSEAVEVFFTGEAGNHNLYTIEENKGGLFSKGGKDLAIYEKIDVIFPALHGTYGEDGSIQGFFDMMDIPYVGCSTTSAALGMDKVFMKQIFIANEIPVLDYCFFWRSEWREMQGEVLDKIEELPYPLFVKPANLGSSIGISKANDRKELVEAIEVACHYDRKILIERAAQDPREINVSVMGYEGDLQVSACEEPLGWKELLSFEDKYIKTDKAGKNQGTKSTEQIRNVPAPLDASLQEQVEMEAMRAFKAIDAAGTARIDFLVEEGKVYVNEINTLPGSIGFYLWEPKGVPFKELITKLIDLGVKVQEQKKENTYFYDSKLLQRTQYGRKL